MRRNGYSYQGKDGNTYQSGAYSAVHKADFVGNKWFLGLVGNNDTTGGACWLCYSHSSYYAEVPEAFLKNSQGQYIDNLGNIVTEENAVENPDRKEFEDKWGTPKDGFNPSAPILVRPLNSKKEELYNENPF